MLLPLLVLALSVGAVLGNANSPNIHSRSRFSSPNHARQNPANITDYQTIVTPQNITIRYKEPGKEGVCETTPGVNSYSGYIDLDRFVDLSFAILAMADVLQYFTHILLVF